MNDYNHELREQVLLHLEATMRMTSSRGQDFSDRIAHPLDPIGGNAEFNSHHAARLAALA